MPKPKRAIPKSGPPARKSRRALLLVVCVAVAAVSLAGLWFFNHGDARLTYVPRPKGSITYNKDIAPIFHQHCLNCHRPGESAHLDLVTYADAKKYAKLISKVVESRYMPPWLPEPGRAEFIDERRLTIDQVGLIRQWVAEGALEGNPADLAALPKWTEGWQLGKPDLIITMPEAYRLEPSGKDIYRNFVIPIPVSETRFVQAVEFRPGNPKVVHHAAMRIDTTPLSQKIDAQEPGPGFGGMTMPESTTVPNGQFLNWQPGKLPYRSPEGLSWILEKNTDMVVQLHLRPGEKPETVQSSIGLFFTDKPPTKEAFKIILDAPTLDIPAGVKDYIATDSFILPVDVDLLAIFPHCHYLGKDLQGFATLPDGSKKWLLHIKQWDFDWQGDYRYKEPVFLPKGSTVTMQFSYDNSTNNVRNPNHPPRRVLFGSQTTDEMGELWIQAVPRSREDFELLQQASNAKELTKMLTTSQHKLTLDPNDAKAHLQLGKVLIGLQRFSEAMPHFETAARLESTNDLPHYFLGVAYRLQGDLPRARRELESALRLNAENYKTHGNLAQIYLDERDLPRAEYHFQTALRLNPDDVLARQGLQRIASLLNKSQ
jgi:tetratricopeptide (TPR) repeat protein